MICSIFLFTIGPVPRGHDIVLARSLCALQPMYREQGRLRNVIAIEDIISMPILQRLLEGAI